MLNIIINPLSESKQVGKCTKRVVNYLKSQKLEFSVYFSETLDEIVSTVKNLYSSNETQFVVVGGDSALSAILNGIEDLSNINIGMIPATDDIDFARHIGLNLNPTQAIKDILEQNVEKVDYLTVNNIKVINNITIGATTDLNDLYEQSKARNFFARTFIKFKNIPKYEGVKLSIEPKGKSEVFDAHIYDMNISNGGLNKGNPVSPLANVKDGLFNFNYVEMLPVEERKKYLSLFKKGNQIYNDNTKQLWLTALKIESETGKIKAMLDGKITELENADIKIVKSGLNLYMKKI